VAEPGESLLELLLQRVAESTLPDAVQELVLAAVEGDSALDAALARQSASAVSTDAEPANGLRDLHLRAVRVHGFRGIAPVVSLDLQPGPGLTVVTGRNGSGKSSFAEAAELALTGYNSRWRDRSHNQALWRGGWRNLHSDDGTTIEVDVVAAGQTGPTTLRMRWEPGAELDERTWTRQPPGGRRMQIDHGWLPDLDLHRPVLSYGELGALLDRRPSELHDALHGLLGLGDLDDARDRLKVRRKPYEDRAKALREARTGLLAALADVDDERARRAEALVGGRPPDLDAVAELALGDDADLAELGRLRAVLAVAVPEPAEIETTVGSVRAAVEAVAGATTGDAAATRSVAELLHRALEHHAAHGDGPCPVCGNGQLDADWRERADANLGGLRALTENLRQANDRLGDAVDAARRLVAPVPSVLRQPPAAVDLDDVVTAWQRWDDVRNTPDPRALADDLERAHSALRAPLADAQASARAEIVRLDQAWKPVAARLSTWHDDAHTVAAEAARLDEIKRAEAWLKTAAGRLRDERIAPFAEASQKVWQELRQESSVDLGALQLTGSGNQRKLLLDVTVDGTDATALSVMSQGELHALGLSLFLPRATVPESPFRFLILDDPVQAMDPAKVEGLARVLAEVAQTRQVVVFSHDDRLTAAARRLPHPPTVWEVQRRAGSRVELVPSVDPVTRYLSDARAVINDRELPDELRREVVASCCRGAVEAAAHAKVRTVRLARGDRHDDVEDALAAADTTRKKLALAVLDDPDRVGDLKDRLARLGPWAHSTLRAVTRGAHAGGYRGNLAALVDDVKRLVGWVLT